ncbi:pirin family protein [Novosphingobium naphthalenivorans]|uniref:pirin family protein n=1 Tax=Novosphingobium naphthalenivorans TaxID=273168 RepID=UPI0009FBE22F|nr:pirin-like C-terminal cupin domain-containing protein [Novosphingobium naphthalenivorans]
MKSRNIKRVDTPKMLPEGSALHRNRQLVAPGQWDEIDPFLLLMEDWYSQGAFQNHPHRGIETVTYMVDGLNSHYDNHGNKGTIASGEALWLTAGRGLIHNEIPIDDRPVHTLQLWVNLPRASKLVDASYQELRGAHAPRRSLPGGEAIVFSGTSGNVVAPTRNHAEVTMVEVRLAPHATFEQELPADYNCFVVILEGAGFLGADASPVRTGQVAWLQHEQDESEVRFETKEESLRAILFAGKPLREPVAARGPFVMNSDAEIEQAYMDFRQQRDSFGLVPTGA